MHACTPAHAAYVFSQNKHTNTRSKHVLLGDKPPSAVFSIKIKAERRCAPRAPSLSAGVIDCDVRSQCTFPVACQPDASWQVRPLTAPAWRRGSRGAAVSEEVGWGQRDGGSWRGSGPGSRPSACRRGTSTPIQFAAQLSSLQGERSCLRRLASM